MQQRIEEFNRLLTNQNNEITRLTAANVQLNTQLSGAQQAQQGAAAAAGLQQHQQSQMMDVMTQAVIEVNEAVSQKKKKHDMIDRAGVGRPPAFNDTPEKFMG